MAEKTAVLSKAQALTTIGLPETAQPLWASAAAYEERIASLLDAQGNGLEAAVHRISAASCYQKAGDPSRATNLYRAALAGPLREGILIEPAAHRSLLEAGCEFATRLVERYRGRKAIVAWQVEHEAVDPLGMEHSWRLSTSFVRAEVEAVRKADPTRPVMMNGFLPTSAPVRLQQWWRTRDQGDSLAVAQQLADVVGIDYYPRHALLGFGGTTLYLEGETSSSDRRRRRALFAWARTQGKRLMVSEGQAEPWEAVTTPPNPSAQTMSSCAPEHVIQNYNRCMGWARDEDFALDAYIFWGAEYWILRKRSGDPRYLQAVARILEDS